AVAPAFAAVLVGGNDARAVGHARKCSGAGSIERARARRAGKATPERTSVRPGWPPPCGASCPFQRSLLLPTSGPRLPWRSPVTTGASALGGARGGTRLGGEGLGLGAGGAAEGNAVAVLLDGLQADALDHGELLDALERAVGLAVVDDGLGLGRADVDQRGRK